MRVRSLLALGALWACAPARPAAGPPAAGPPPDVVLRAVLAAAADTVLAGVRATRLYAADAATAQALALAARRLGVAVAPAPGPVWCADSAGVGRAVGILLRLRADSVGAEGARVGWATTCLITPQGERTPSAFGGGGVYEVVRRGGRWRAARALAEFAF